MFLPSVQNLVTSVRNSAARASRAFDVSARLHGDELLGIERLRDVCGAARVVAGDAVAREPLCREQHHGHSAQPARRRAPRAAGRAHPCRPA